MTSYTLSPFLLTRVQTGVWLWILFSCPLACCLLLLFFYLILFLSFPETNLGSAEKASVKDEGRLLTACAYEALMLWATGYCFFDCDIISMTIHLSLSSRKVIVRIKCNCPIIHIKVKTY